MEGKRDTGDESTRWFQDRQVTAQQRKRLFGPAILRFAAESVPSLHKLGGPAPAECLLELTDAAGGLVPWCGPDFFDRLLGAWGKEELTVRLAATPGAILNETILERLADIRGRATGWQLVADSDGGGLTSMAALNRLLAGPYHQIDFHADYLPGDEETDYQPHTPSKNRVFSAMRELILLRNARQQDKPTVLWIYRPASAETAHRLRAEALARQLQVDRFESA